MGGGARVEMGGGAWVGVGSDAWIRRGCGKRGRTRGVRRDGGGRDGMKGGVDNWIGAGRSWNACR